jgi:4-oxalmesaconate hydratase
MIIDCHGHYTTAPPQLGQYRDAQIAALGTDPGHAGDVDLPAIGDDDIRASLEGAQLRLQHERGTDLTLFSPRASWMGHHVGNIDTSRFWAQRCNDLIRRACDLYPDRFVPVCQLPQSPGAPIEPSVHELARCVTEMGFVGCNLNPDPSGGYWDGPPLPDRSWYPLYEALCELDVPAMIHVSAACNPNFHTTGSHYLGADTTAFVQLLLADLFADFPTLRLIIPHGGGAVPYHWGRFRGLAQDLGRPSPDELLADNVFFDTCVYHQAGIDCLLAVIPADNILFASEMIGAVRGVDPRTGHHYDDTRRYLDAAGLSDEDRRKIFEGNIRRVFPRVEAVISS